MVFKFFKAIWDDLKGDVKFIKQCFKNFKEEKPMIDKERLDYVKKGLTTGWGDFFKEAWWILIICVMFFVAGFYLSSQIYESKCNEFLFEQVTILEDYYELHNPDVPKFNFSQTFDELNDEFDPGEGGS